MPWLVAGLYWAASFFAARMLIGIGVGWITFAGFLLIFQELSNEITAAWGMVDAEAYQLLSLAGIPDAIGIILGAFSARVTILGMSRLGKLVGS